MPNNDELFTEQEIIEQVDEAIEAIEDAIENSKPVLAENILEQIEQWKKETSLTSEQGKKYKEEMEQEITLLKQEVAELKAKLSGPAKPSDPQEPTKLLSTPTPPSDEKPTERPAREEVALRTQLPSQEQKARPKRVGI